MIWNKNKEKKFKKALESIDVCLFCTLEEEGQRCAMCLEEAKSKS